MMTQDYEQPDQMTGYWGIPQPPESLNDHGKGRWQQIIGVLIQRGTWRVDWYFFLETLCQNYQHLDAIEKVIQEQNDNTVGGFPMLVSVGKSGAKINPLLEFRLKTIQTINHQLNYLGLTPSASSMEKPTSEGETTTKVDTTISRPKLSVKSFDDDAA